MGRQAETLSTLLPEEVEAAARRVLQSADAAGLKLASAESCTGGLLASLLTDVEGLSHCFERGFVVYSNRAKCDLLGLEQARIDRCGAVSRDVAIAMARGALARSQADIAVAITGFAGPGKEDEEEGLVHLACIRGGREPGHREEHFGPIGRGPVRIESVRVALEMLAEALDCGGSKGRSPPWS